VGEFEDIEDGGYGRLDSQRFRWISHILVFVILRMCFESVNSIEAACSDSFQ